MEGRLDKFFSKELLRELQLTEEDSVFVRGILKRFLIFNAKEDVKEFEELSLPPPKKNRFLVNGEMVTVTLLQPQTSEVENSGELPIQPLENTILPNERR